jgi:hypothetical protein
MTSSNYLNAVAPKSFLGFGAMRLPDKKQSEKLIDTFLDGGFNYFDTAWIYGGSEESLRETLVKRHSRDKFFIANKLPPWLVENHADCDKIFFEQFKRTGLDFFDFYLIHSLEDERETRDEKKALFEWAAEKKRKGLIKHVGFSFHGTTAYLSRILEKQREVEFVMLQLNYSDIMRGAAGEWHQLAINHGIPIIVMEPVRGGALAKLPAPAEKILRDYNSKRSVASWAVQYAATLQGVTCVLSGMSNMEQLLDNMKTFENLKPLTEAEIQMLEDVLVEMGKIASVPCTACKYCHPHCPEKINIAECFSLYNDLKRGGLDWNLAMMYKTLPKGNRAENCTACGACVSNCPQHIDIPKELGTAAKVFIAN